MRRFVWFLVVVLAIAHWDYWNWNDRGLVAGFLPVGLAYHAAFSVAAGATWALVARFAWPAGIERWASEGDGAGDGRGAVESDEGPANAGGGAET
ncbi:MAG: hypothetical protein QF903_05845 [Planctomycetota bacterium]|nr:hypothetical protein [Planctomycetota bacterium]